MVQELKIALMWLYVKQKPKVGKVRKKEFRKFIFQGPNSEGIPYLMVEIQAIAVFDTKETCKLHAPKIFQALTKLSGQPQENIHVLLKPLEKHNVAVNGAIKE